MKSINDHSTICTRMNTSQKLFGLNLKKLPIAHFDFATKQIYADA